MPDYSRKWLALLAVGSGVFMATIDGSIVNIALKTIQDSFAAPFHIMEWVVLCYLLTITCLLPIMGRLGDMFGKKRIALIGFGAVSYTHLDVYKRQTLSSVQGRVLTADTMQAHNSFDQPDLVQPVAFDGASIIDNQLHIMMPAKSVVVLELLP